MCNIKKNIEDVYKKYTACKNCNSIKNLNRYSENRDRKSGQQKVYCEESRDKFLQKRIIR